MVAYGNLAPLRSDSNAPCVLKSVGQSLQGVCAGVPSLDRDILRTVDYRIEYCKRNAVGAFPPSLHADFAEVV